MYPTANTLTEKLAEAAQHQGPGTPLVALTPSEAALLLDLVEGPFVPSDAEVDAASERMDMGADEWYAEAYAAQFDDDPNPYHGDYSEE